MNEKITSRYDYKAKRSVEALLNLPEPLIKILDKAFLYESTMTSHELKTLLGCGYAGVGDPWNHDYSFGATTVAFRFRDAMIERGFVFPTSDLLDSIDSLAGVRPVIDLACGTGWLSGWLRKRGLDVTAVDNKSWKFSKFEKDVIKCDAVNYVKNHPNPLGIYILSWPYMNDMAARIWKAMRSGERLLYIGEGGGGCTANDEFFAVTEGCEREDVKGLYQFWGLHDYAELLTKP